VRILRLPGRSPNSTAITILVDGFVEPLQGRASCSAMQNCNGKEQYDRLLGAYDRFFNRESPHLLCKIAGSHTATLAPRATQPTVSVFGPDVAALQDFFDPLRRAASECDKATSVRRFRGRRDSGRSPQPTTAKSIHWGPCMPGSALSGRPPSFRMQRPG
jgi:hypothetical protein